MRTSSELVEQREKDQREKDCWIVNGFLMPIYIETKGRNDDPYNRNDSYQIIDLLTPVVSIQEC